MSGKTRLFGFDLLRQQALNAVLEALAVADDWVEGDSEIERLFCAALVFRITYGRTEYLNAPIATKATPVDFLKSRSSARASLIIEPQVEIGPYRVDFVVHAWTDGRVWSLNGGGSVYGDARWRKLVVECDGHDYHERTKEQAAKDRSRDHELNGAGYDVFRFTGSELWRDPWECADQVYQWATRGLG